MDNSNNTKKINTSYQPPKPKFLSSENPEVVNNLDMNISGMNSSNISKFDSVDGSLENGITYYSPNNASIYKSYNASVNQIQSSRSHNENLHHISISNYTENTASEVYKLDSNTIQPTQQPSIRSIKTETHVVREKVKEKKEGFISKIVKEILGFIGCMLLILSIIILAFIYIINF